MKKSKKVFRFINVVLGITLNCVGGGLADQDLKDATSNLSEDLKEDALHTFLDSIKSGLTVKESITLVQDSALTKVPNERNKFYIKFVYDNQLEVSIAWFHREEMNTWPR